MKNLLGNFFSRIIGTFSAADLEWLEGEIRQTLFRKNAVSYRFASLLNWQSADSNWNYYFSPWRPSKGDLENYARALFPLGRDSRILILGATPELRDLVASFGFKTVVVADFSLQMIVEMLQYAKNVKIDDEIWIKSDWLNLPLGGDFDAVLGDLALRMIEAGRQREFLRKIKNILSSRGGIFVTRVHFVDESLSGLSVDRLVDIPVAGSDERSVVCAIGGRIFDKFSDLNENVVCRREAVEFTRSAAIRELNSKKKNILLKIQKFLSGKIEWQIIPKKIGWAANGKAQLDGLIGDFFEIVDIRTSGDYPDSEFYPVYLLKFPSPVSHGHGQNDR